MTAPTPTTLVVRTGPHSPKLDQSSYLAPAGQELTIHFVNSVFTAQGHKPVPFALSISRSDDPAGYSVPDRPGLSVFEGRKAIAITSRVVPPDTGVMSVPPLAAGTYLLQVVGAPQFSATLEVR